jgi:oligosaccharide repeat unit polymerase
MTPMTFHSRSNTSSARVVLLIAPVALLLGLGFFHYQARPPDFIMDREVWLASWLFTAVCGWVYGTAYVVGWSAMSPYMLLVTAAIFFNGGQVILMALGLGNMPLFGYTSVGNGTKVAAVYATSLGLFGLHVGALLGGKLAPHAARSEILPTTPNWDRALQVAGWLLLAGAVVPTYTSLTTAIDVSSVGYSALYQQEVETGFDSWQNSVAGYLLPGVFLLLAGGRDKKHVRAITLGVVLIYVSSYFFIGVRSKAAMALLAYVWLWDRLVGKISRKWLASSAMIIILLIFPFINVMRAMSIENRMKVNMMKTGIEKVDNPAVASISEMGASLGAMAHTMNLVPAPFEYQLGITYYYAILRIVPNVAWEIHPSVAYGSASDWMAQQIDPFIVEAGGGFGYSMFAEAFLNFGWPGILFVMFAFGFATERLWIKSLKNNRVGIYVIIACVMAFGLQMVRGEFIHVARPFVWYALVPWLVAVMVHQAITYGRLRGSGPRGRGL